MALIKLSIFDEDDEYCFSLCSHLTHHYKETLIVNSFSSTFSIQEWIEKTDPDIVLTSELYYRQICNVFNKDIIILTSGRNSANLEEGLTIYKYKGINQIVGDIVNIFTKSGNIIRTPGDKTTKIAAVYSAAGGSGKTTISLGMGSTCSNSGLSVFYLNLEQFQTTNGIFSNNHAYSFSNIIYHAMERDKNLTPRLSAMACNDTASNLYYFNAADNALEMEELGPEEVAAVIKAVKESGKYDLILVDMDCRLSNHAINVFEIADEVLYVLTEEEICLHKTKMFLETISRLSNSSSSYAFLLHKFIFVLNKASQQALQHLVSHLDIKITSQIPFRKELTSMKGQIKAIGGPEVLTSAFKELSNRYL